MNSKHFSTDGKGSRLGFKLCYVSAVWVSVLGVVSALSWAFDIPALRGLGVPQLETKPNTSLGFFLLGIATILLINPANKTKMRIGHILAAIVALIGALTFIEILFDINLGIDSLLKNIASPRMVAASALAFFLAGLSLLIIDVEIKKYRPAQFLGSLVALIPFEVLIAYSEGKESVLHVGRQPFLTQMAPHTALGWLSRASPFSVSVPITVS